MKVWVAQHVADYGYGEGYSDFIGVFATPDAAIKHVEQVWWPAQNNERYGYQLSAVRPASYNADVLEWTFSVDHTIELWPEEVQC